MTSEHTLRRLGRLNRYPTLANRTEAELLATLEDALATFLDLTHRSVDPGEVVDSIICDLAKSYLSKAGQEGVKRAKDGEFEREWSDNGGIEPILLKRIIAYRQVVGINATPLL